ncbi:hypothetical protein [Glutamicibacter arilaitensis]|uniref:Uncharacterized protein n=1 Tax=Glutamicibacter arilaitensis TaxID=256701 RepID=A0A2N7S676_9MICC|nr:hypothetical protein [Glutamicibacter arilaitensis]PMQ21640.1 hypothetical protein CIK84_08950 [Glutamicibacter arilaitensis]
MTNEAPKNEARLPWTGHGDGVWSLPATVISNDECEVMIGAIWTDEDGLQVTIEAPEGMIPAALVPKVTAAMIDLSFHGQHGPAGA